MKTSSKIKLFLVSIFKYLFFGITVILETILFIIEVLLFILSFRYIRLNYSDKLLKWSKEKLQQILQLEFDIIFKN